MVLETNGGFLETNGGYLDVDYYKFPRQNDLKVLFDPNDPKTINFQPGSNNIAALNDKRFNGIVAVQPTSARQALYVPSGIGGLGTMRFDGAYSQSLYIGEAISTFLQMSNWTIFIIAQRTGDVIYQSLLSKGVGYVDTPPETNICWTMTSNTSGKFQTGFEQSDGTDRFANANTTLSTTASCVTSRKSSTLLEIRINGALEGSLDVTGLSPAPGESRIGIGAGYRYNSSLNDQHFTGDIGDILIYDVTLTDAEMIEIETVLRDKRGLL